MKAIVNTQELGKQLKKIAPVINKNTVIPVLSCAKLLFEKKKLTIEATDLETTIIVSMDCECKDSFVVLIEFVDLLGVCSKIDDPIKIDASGEHILITSNDAKFKFAKIGNQEVFPKLPDDEFLFSLEVESDFFWSLACANVCKSDNNLRPDMNGVSVKIKKDGISIAGTDALFAYKNDLKLKTGKEAQMLVCEKFVNMVRGLSDGKLFVGEKFIKIDSPQMLIISRLFDAKFVNLDSILPDKIDYNFKVNRSNLIHSLDITGVAGSLSTMVSVMNFNGGDVKIVSHNIDFGKEAETTLKASHSVGIKQIGINGGQMLKLLNLFDSEEMEMAFTEENRTIFLRPTGEPNTLCLLQPVGII